MNLGNKIISCCRIDPIGVTMPGARLPERVRKIVHNAPIMRISFVRAACVAACCTMLCAALAAVRLARAQDGATDDWEQAAGGKMSFDVASVKQNKSSEFVPGTVPLDSTNSYPPNGGLFSTTRVPLFVYIGFAYKLMPGIQYQSVVSQLPSWASTNSYDIQARAAGNPTKDQMRLMMQSLLADRFKLVVHWEYKQSPVFALVLVKPGKPGPQLKPHLGESGCAGPTVAQSNAQVRPCVTPENFAFGGGTGTGPGPGPFA